jgi:hypothetical protein
VLPRGQNHDTFTIHRIDHDARPDLARRFGVTGPPPLVVAESKGVRAGLEQPRGCVEIQTLLAPWLR